MLDTVERQHRVAAERWLTDAQAAFDANDSGALRALFLDDSYWRDAVALTGTLATETGADQIASRLGEAASRHQLTGLKIDDKRIAPRLVDRAGMPCLETFLRFETDIGWNEGILRLREDPADGSWKAWTLLTALDDLKGAEAHVGAHRPTGQSHSRDFRGPNWLDQRRSEEAYEDRDPTVLIVGGGQAGLATAAQLVHLGVDALVIDKNARIGDNWRNRYHALTLHNQVQVNHLPFIPFPPGWPTYIPKDKLANWFESYVDAMEINYWTGSELVSGQYDDASGRWTAEVRRSSGETRTLRPKHIVMATGVSGIPNRPNIPTLDAFKGPVLHSSEYADGEDWTGKSAIVIGSGNSAHDISQDLTSSGAKVTMVQRSPTLVVNIEPSAQFPYGLYSEGLPVEDCDLITTATPVLLVRKAHVAFTEKAKQTDKPLLDRLEKVGFRLDFGDDGTGWQFKYLTRGGGYYFNVGCSDMIADGQISLLQNDQIAQFTTEGLETVDGANVPADLIVLSTGYQRQEVLVERLFGVEVAERVGPIWGFGDGLELRNMYTRTPQDGLWFIAGSLAQCRINSKYLALQIKMLEQA